MNVNNKNIPRFLVPLCEDIRTEFKVSFNVSVIETLVAFANTSGGSVYIGINDAGTAVGVIVEDFYLTGDIEKYGTGYNRVRKAIKTYPTMQFDYHETQDGYLVELSYQRRVMCVLCVNNHTFRMK